MGRHASAPARHDGTGPEPAPSRRLLHRLALTVVVAATTTLVLAWGGTPWLRALLLGAGAGVVVAVGALLAASIPAPAPGPEPRRDDDEPVQ
ncbi:MULTISPECIES: hypothetical protein [unclassified Actinotalea]|uniref:hypothetical protein n=1 Tax=unclassified Actinotalea TaxID=2638618 RepID=UPI0015F72764|nr:MULTISPECIES: hypothetical protein [unclassified Actinotalea]